MLLVPPPLVGARAPAITALDYVTNVSQSNSGASLTLMNGIDAGDLLFWLDTPMNSDATYPNAGLPSGFGQIDNRTLIVHGSAWYGRLQASFKIADGTEDGATLTGCGDAISDKKICIQYRPNVPLGSLSYGGVVFEATDGDPAQKTIAASAGIGLVLGITHFACRVSGYPVAPRTTSITPDHELMIGGSTSLYVQDYLQESNPQDYTFDMDDEVDSNTLWGCYLHMFDVSGK